MPLDPCANCGHGYGVHQQVRQPLRIWQGKVEFYQSEAEAPQECTGYPDMMKRDGNQCLCRGYTKENTDDGTA